jgi:hypothetical protein
MPDGITSIGDFAFSGCTGLTSINIPAGVVGIGEYAFQSCYRLTSISIPASVVSIGTGAFNNCFGLTAITVLAAKPPKAGDFSLGSSAVIYVSDIPAYMEAAGWKNHAGKIVNKDGLNVQNGVLVKYYGNAKELVIPAGVTRIGDGVFSGCTELTSISIPASVTYIGNEAFADTSITSITIGANVTLYKDEGRYAFANGFDAFYTTNGKKAGTYRFIKDTWSMR